METFLKWIDHGLLSMGLSSATSHAVDNYLAILIAFLLSLLVTWLANRYLIPVICKFINHTHTRWDDLLLNPRVLRSLCRLLPPFILYHAVPFFSADSEIPGWIDIGCRIYLSVGFMALGTSVVKTAYTVWDTFDKLKDEPIKGFLQVVNLLIYIVTGIVIVSILLDKSPVHLLTGLGASAAIVSLIFKDTIVNFISGIQLSAHDMLRPGDWITVSKHGINGTVEDITLNTVKIRNFDHTILTIPPYLLVNEPFQNWRYMKESGSRRMVQTLCIDIRSVRLLSLEEVAALPAYPLVKDLPELQPGGESLRSFPDRIVNLTLFRHYVQHYLAHHPIARTEDRFFVVRELPHTPQGIPLEILLFLNETQWEKFEDWVSDLMEPLVALAPDFALRIYQQPSSADFGSIGRALEADAAAPGLQRPAPPTPGNVRNS